MADRLATAATWMARKHQDYHATTATYRRGGSALTSIAITRGTSGRQVDQLTGILSWNDQDWLIPASVLTLGEPLRGDKIEVGDEVYEVLATEGEDCWRWSDNHQKLYRIHS
jgi:hypothetical protein